MARIARMDKSDEPIAFVSLVQFVAEKGFGCDRRPRWVLRSLPSFVLCPLPSVLRALRAWTDRATKNFCLILDFCTTYRSRETSSYGRMNSSQRHQDRRDNPPLLAGDGWAPAPCPRLRGGRLAVVKIRAKQSQLAPGSAFKDQGSAN